MDCREKFKKYANYPLYGNLSMVVGFGAGFVLYLFRFPIQATVACSVAGLLGEFYFARRYRCPHCDHYLWRYRDKEMRHCPECDARLRD
jgi:hypothetical protein